MDIATHIQHKLIQAYCLENDINIIELDQKNFNELFAIQRTKIAECSSHECVLMTCKPIDEFQDMMELGVDENIGWTTMNHCIWLNQI